MLQRAGEITSFQRIKLLLSRSRDIRKVAPRWREKITYSFYALSQIHYSQIRGSCLFARLTVRFAVRFQLNDFYQIYFCCPRAPPTIPMPWALIFVTEVAENRKEGLRSQNRIRTAKQTKTNDETRNTQHVVISQIYAICLCAENQQRSYIFRSFVCQFSWNKLAISAYARALCIFIRRRIRRSCTIFEFALKCKINWKVWEYSRTGRKIGCPPSRNSNFLFMNKHSRLLARQLLMSVSRASFCFSRFTVSMRKSRATVLRAPALSVARVNLNLICIGRWTLIQPFARRIITMFLRESGERRKGIALIN